MFFINFRRAPSQPVNVNERARVRLAGAFDRAGVSSHNRTGLVWRGVRFARGNVTRPRVRYRRAEFRPFASSLRDKKRNGAFAREWEVGTRVMYLRVTTHSVRWWCSAATNYDSSHGHVPGYITNYDDSTSASSHWSSSAENRSRRPNSARLDRRPSPPRNGDVRQYALRTRSQRPRASPNTRDRRRDGRRRPCDSHAFPSPRTWSERHHTGDRTSSSTKTKACGRARTSARAMDVFACLVTLPRGPRARGARCFADARNVRRDAFGVRW